MCQIIARRCSPTAFALTVIGANAAYQAKGEKPSHCAGTSVPRSAVPRSQRPTMCRSTTDQGAPAESAASHDTLSTPHAPEICAGLRRRHPHAYDQAYSQGDVAALRGFPSSVGGRNTRAVEPAASRRIINGCQIGSRDRKCQLLEKADQQAATVQSVFDYCCKKDFGCPRKQFKISPRYARLIQRFPGCDSIVASKPPLADFCNNIGPSRRFGGCC
jgi:hypothetical protein